MFSCACVRSIAGAESPPTWATYTFESQYVYPPKLLSYVREGGRPPAGFGDISLEKLNRNPPDQIRRSQRKTSIAAVAETHTIMSIFRGVFQ